MQRSEWGNGVEGCASPPALDPACHRKAISGTSETGSSRYTLTKKNRALLPGVCRQKNNCSINA
jgi:hypothetical protein